jgi:hypothetical protein
MRHGRRLRRRTDGFGSTAEHGYERVRRFAGEHAARILPSLIRTEARDRVDISLVRVCAGAADAERRARAAPP